MMTWELLCVAGFGLSVILTGVMHGYALRRQILDVPTGRSSHTVPTPRGGGVAFVISFCMLLFAKPFVWQTRPENLAAIAGAGLAMALLGFLDDHRPIHAGWRLVAHFAAAAWALVWVGPGWIPQFFGATPWRQGLGYGVSALGIVWLVNLYNFMDGIDGIASIEAITVCVPATILWFVADPHGAWAVPLLLAACTAGFLAWNFPPARIFMGDAGSNFLGVILAIFAMVAAAADARLLWAWGILLGAFIVDATVTLLRRLQRRERVHQAHRSHAYQYASRKHGGHRPVSLATAGINVLFLFPIGTGVARGWLSGPVGIALAYVPLALLAIRYKAGAREKQESP